MNFLRKVLVQYSVASLTVFTLLTSDNSYAAPMENPKFVDVNGIKTRYFEGGSGEAMLLVHGSHFGLTSSAYGWMPIFDHLARHFHVYAIDKLGMGYTDNPGKDSEYSMEATIDHIYGFLRTLGIEKVHLVGASRGVLPVARVAIDYPEMADSLVFFDTGTLAPEDPTAPPRVRGRGSESTTPTKESIRQSMLASPSSKHKDYITDWYVEAQLRVALLPKIKEAEQKMSSLFSQWVRLNPEKRKKIPDFERTWWFYELKEDTLELIRAGGLKAPTLIIWGYDDPSASYTRGIELFKIINLAVKRSQLHLINDCGHSPYAEYPQEVTRLVVNFIEGS